MEQILEILRIVAGSIFVLYLPGLFLSYAFFKGREIDVIERIALSLALSIAVVPLAVFYLNVLLGIKITTLSVSITILSILLVTFGYLFFKNIYKQDKS